MGLSEREYYTNSPYTNYCKAKGYEEKTDKLEGMFRNIGYIAYCANTDKSKRESITKFWPISSDKKVQKDTLKISREMLQQIKAAHNLK